jgi:beta-glucosidase
MPRMKAAAALDSRTASSEDGRGPSVWDGYSKVPGHIAHGDIGDVACDHWYARLIHAEAMKVLT